MKGVGDGNSMRPGSLQVMRINIENQRKKKNIKQRNLATSRGRGPYSSHPATLNRDG